MFAIFVISISIILSVCGQDYFPILTAPENTSVLLNATVMLRCIVDVRKMENGDWFKVIWSKDDFGIGGSRADIREYRVTSKSNYSRFDLPNNLDQGDYSLQIQHVHVLDEGVYACQVTSSNGRLLQSKSAKLSVLLPSNAPKIYQLSQLSFDDPSGRLVTIEDPASVKDGEILYLKCYAANGKPGAELVWLNSDGSVIPRSMTKLIKPEKYKHLNLDIADSYSIVEIKCSKLRHGTTVTCQANNQGYEWMTPLKAETKINVNWGPETSMEVMPNHSFYEEKEVVQFRCSANGRPEKFSWQWGLNKTVISGETSSNFQIIVKKELHNTVIWCSATSNVGSHESRHTLHVIYAPGFTNPTPELYSASIGESITMNCLTTGNPKPDIIWQKEGKADQISNRQDLNINYVTSEDFGTYICTANSQNFNPIFKTFYLRKKSAPTVSADPNQKSPVGYSGKITCDVISIPLPSDDQVQWYFNQELIQKGKNHKFSIERVNHLHGVQIKLIINQVDYADFGEYRCEVSNGYGTDAKSVLFSFDNSTPFTFIIGATVAATITFCFSMIIYFIVKRRACSFGSYAKASLPRHAMPTTNKVQSNHNRTLLGASEMYPSHPGSLYGHQQTYLTSGTDGKTTPSLTAVPVYMTNGASKISHPLNNFNTFIHYPITPPDDKPFVNGTLMRPNSSLKTPIEFVQVASCEANGSRLNSPYPRHTVNAPIYSTGEPTNEMQFVNASTFQLTEGTQFAYLDTNPILGYESCNEPVLFDLRPIHNGGGEGSVAPEYRMYSHNACLSPKHRQNGHNSSKCLSPVVNISNRSPLPAMKSTAFKIDSFGEVAAHI